MSVVRLEDVTKTFPSTGGTVHAVNGVSLSIAAGETLALIGESGSGKSTLGRLLLGLYRPDSGMMEFEGRDLTGLDTHELQRVREKLTVVFQEPDESLNPRMTIGQNIAEPLRIHAPALSRHERIDKVSEVLEAVSLPTDIVDRTPRQLSGGQQQRVGIARAIVTDPRFVVLDEPTSSLDLSVQSQIITLLGDLQQRLELSFLFITHDIHTVHYVADRIAVMYLGQVVETGPTDEVFNRPKHPYTLALLASTLTTNPRDELPKLKVTGEVPKPTDLPKGCLFYSRCPYRNDERCAEERPPLVETSPGHFVRSFYELDEDERREIGLLR